MVKPRWKKKALKSLETSRSGWTETDITYVADQMRKEIDDEIIRDLLESKNLHIDGGYGEGQL